MPKTQLLKREAQVRFLVRELDQVPTLQLKILHAMTKTQHSQINKQILKNKNHLEVLTLPSHWILKMLCLLSCLSVMVKA